MKKSSVYTRTGDCGTTQLASGERVAKTCTRLEAYGTIDELNSHLGLLFTDIDTPAERERIIQTQRDLCAIGAILATSPEAERRPRCSITADDILQLEHAIDAAADGLPAWRGFVLPGGCRAAAQAHVCRTVCRRAERAVLRLNEESPIAPEVVTYINRLSDYLFILASKINFLAGKEEILW